jgi:hypothetical protein
MQLPTLQDHHAALRRSLQVGHHALEVQALGLRVNVAVQLPLQASVTEDCPAVPRKAAAVGGAWVAHAAKTRSQGVEILHGARDKAASTPDCHSQHFQDRPCRERYCHAPGLQPCTQDNPSDAYPSAVRCTPARNQECSVHALVLDPGGVAEVHLAAGQPASDEVGADAQRSRARQRLQVDKAGYADGSEAADETTGRQQHVTPACWQASR